MRRMGIGLGVGINRSNYAQGIFSAYQSRVVADGGVTEAGACVDAVSGLLQTASLLLIPSGYKSGKAYAEIPTNGNGDLTWTRASTAIRTNSLGLLESMGSGVPRLSYMYGSCPALLLEPQRTNLALYSEQFDNAYWTKNATSVTANTTTSPDGTTNADKIVENSALAEHFVAAGNITYAAGAYTISVYAKASERSVIQLFFNGSINIVAFANFDLANGVVGSTGSGTTATITSVGNGWYRCAITATCVLGTAPGLYYCIQTSTTATRAQTYTGNGTSGLFVWGAQLELGAYPTTIIPTTTASATRIADSFSRNNIYTNGLITSSGGTWFVQFRVQSNAQRDNSNALRIGDANNSFDISGSTSGYGFIVGKVVSATYSNILFSNLGASAFVKLAIKWNGTTADVFANGTKVVSATSFTPTDLPNLSGSFGSALFIQAMGLHPTPLTDAQCIELTTL